MSDDATSAQPAAPPTDAYRVRQVSEMLPAFTPPPGDKDKPGEIFAAMIRVMEKVDAVGKSKTNTEQHYQFRSIDEILDTVKPALTAAGVFVIPRVVTRQHKPRTSAKGGAMMHTIFEVAFTFCAKDGSAVTVVTIGEAMDSGDKSCNKAHTTAFKNALIEVFAIPVNEPADTENDNYQMDASEAQAGPRNTSRQTNAPANSRPNGNSGGARQQQQAPPPRPPTKSDLLTEFWKLIDDTKTPPNKMDEWLRKANTDEPGKMTIEQLGKCVGWLRWKKKEMAAAKDRGGGASAGDGTSVGDASEAAPADYVPTEAMDATAASAAQTTGKEPTSSAPSRSEPPAKELPANPRKTFPLDPMKINDPAYFTEALNESFDARSFHANDREPAMKKIAAVFGVDAVGRLDDAQRLKMITDIRAGEADTLRKTPADPSPPAKDEPAKPAATGATTSPPPATTTKKPVTRKGR